MSEAQLAARMGISKTPVREALLRLQSDGLVEIHPQRGSFVFRLDAVEVGQLCRYRSMIECAALREAMAERPRALLDAMAACVAQMRKAEKARDLKAIARIDMDLHWQFLAHCPNRYLAEGYSVVRWQLTALRYRSPIANAVSSHQVLVAAVEDGDADRAAALLHVHVVENEPRYITANAQN